MARTQVLAWGIIKVEVEFLYIKNITDSRNIEGLLLYNSESAV